MPSNSAKQHRFMEAVAHDPGFAKKAGVPQAVGQEFAEADKNRSPYRLAAQGRKESDRVAASHLKRKR